MSRESNNIFSENPEVQKEEQVYEKIQSSDIEWSVPVESVPLPSRGAIYPEGTFFYNKEFVEIKSMTAKEEDILMSQAYIKKGVVIDELVKSCINKVGVDPRELIAGDKMALAITIRITGYGPDYIFNHNCPNCNQKSEINYNLSNLGIKRLGVDPIKPGVNAFEYILPVSKRKVIFKLLTNKDEDEIEKQRENYVQITEKDDIVTSTLFNSIISVDGITDRVKIHKFINNMPARDSKMLRNYIRDISPGLDMDIDVECPKCQTTSSVRLPINSELFYPE